MIDLAEERFEKAIRTTYALSSAVLRTPKLPDVALAAGVARLGPRHAPVKALSTRSHVQSNMARQGEALLPL
jgi:hypothetical protein